MAHRIYIIERLHGEASARTLKEHASRIIGRPRGDLGVETLPSLNSESYSWSPVTRSINNVLISFDGTSYVVESESQSGAISLAGDMQMVVPGGGIVDIDSTSGSIVGVCLSNNDGVIDTSIPSLSVSVTSSSTTGSWTNATIFALAVAYRYTRVGYVPIAISTSSASSIGGTVSVTASTDVQVDLIEVFLLFKQNGVPSNEDDWDGWERVVSAPKTTSASVELDAPPSGGYRPTLLGINTGNNGAFLDGFVYAAGRGFYAAGLSDARTLTASWDSTNNVGSLVFKPSNSHQSTILYGEPSYSGLSPHFNFVDVSSKIIGLSKSPRGIFAFTSSGLKELYGDFTTSLKVTEVPVSITINENGASIAYSGDIVYVNSGFRIDKMTTGGVKRIGEVVRDGVQIPYSMDYDSTSNKLFVSQNNEYIRVYDPIYEWWYSIPARGFDPTNKVVVFHAGSWRIGNTKITESDSYEPVVLEFNDIDLALPGIKKRIHYVKLGYTGEVVSVDAKIYNKLTDEYLYGRVNVSLDGINIHFPPVVSDLISFRISVKFFDYGAILVPIIIVYEPRQAIYE